MSIVVRFNPRTLRRRCTRRASGDSKRPDVASGRSRVPRLVRSEGNLKVSEIWDSQEQLEAFGQTMMPILADIGIEFSGAPDVFEVHNIIKR